jgi:hypothetical protein
MPTGLAAPRPHLASDSRTTLRRLLREHVLQPDVLCEVSQYDLQGGRPNLPIRDGNLTSSLMFLPVRNRPARTPGAETDTSARAHTSCARHADRLCAMQRRSGSARARWAKRAVAPSTLLGPSLVPPSATRAASRRLRATRRPLGQLHATCVIRLVLPLFRAQANADSAGLPAPSRASRPRTFSRLQPPKTLC